MDKLAVDGGPPVRSEPFPQRGHVGIEEKAAIMALFDRAIATRTPPGYNGPEEEQYCAAFADALGGGYADGVSSGTAGLYVALRALELDPFTEVIVGAVTDPGGMMPIPLLNLIPMVADTAPGSYNTGPEQVAALITPLTRAIVIPHIGGEPADIAGIVAIARDHGIPVIEDCSQSHGARLHGNPVGTFGNIAVFSTMFGKHHCTGGQGGLIYTRDESLYHILRRAADRGKPFFLPEGTTNVMASLNFNLSELGAALGRVQLRKLPGFVQRRREIVAQLSEGLQDVVCASIPQPLPGAEPSYWFLRVRFHPQACRVDKLTYCQALQAEGLPVTPDYRAALPHTMKWFNERRVFGQSGYPWSSPDYRGNQTRQFPCPNAMEAIATHFNVALHEGWRRQEIQDTLAIFHKVDSVYRA